VLADEEVVGADCLDEAVARFDPFGHRIGVDRRVPAAVDDADRAIDVVDCPDGVDVLGDAGGRGERADAAGGRPARLSRAAATSARQPPKLYPNSATDSWRSRAQDRAARVSESSPTPSSHSP